jgi:hypothetical protein
MSMPLLRVKGWNEHFENNRTRELKKLDWVPVPNKQDGDGYTELIDHPEGPLHFAAWMAIIQIASKCDTRGTLSREGAKPHDARSLARISRIPAAVFESAIPRLVEIGWLESIAQEATSFQRVTSIPQHAAAIPQGGAPSRAREKGMEGNGMEGNSTAANPPAADESLDQIRRWLHEYVEGKQLGWLPPDREICRKVLAVCRGDLERLHELLIGLYKQDRAPGRSYSWFVAVIQGEFEGEQHGNSSAA